jgi:hypothetical protein
MKSDLFGSILEEQYQKATMLFFTVLFLFGLQLYSEDVNIDFYSVLQYRG